ncbi:MAG: methyltransferase domain-containing protein [Rhodothermaceae bacterium]|nr:methyltransferase domain-containing protein [Rhodothermaceae bacterium]
MFRKSFLLTAAALSALGTVAWTRRRGRAASSPQGVLGPEAVRSLYDRLAPVYDALAAAYGLLGAGQFHRRAVGALGLRVGDTVVDLACGTGANFSYLIDAVGTTGRVVGVDLSPGMLAKARERVERHGWANVELVEADVRAFAFPEPLHGVISTFGLEMVPEHEAVIERAVGALAPGGRVAVGGLRRPEGWPEWLIRLGELVNRPFGVSRAYEGVQPWHSVRHHTTGVRYEEHLFGAAYLAAGTRPDEP